VEQVSKNSQGEIIDSLTRSETERQGTYIAGMGPVVTVDWAEHQRNWMGDPVLGDIRDTDGIVEAEADVFHSISVFGGNTINLIHFYIRQHYRNESGDIDWVWTRNLGYSRDTGVLVSFLTAAKGVRGGQDLDMKFVLRLSEWSFEDGR
jgi:hypothetical protein